MDRDRIITLLDRYSDGSSTAEERVELENYLKNSTQVQRLFWEHAQMSALLREACQQEAGREMADVDACKEVVSFEPTIDGRNAAAGGTASSQAVSPRKKSDNRIVGDNRRFSARQVAAVAAAAVLFGSGLTLWWTETNSNRPEQITRYDSIDRFALDAPPATTLINLTNCRWDSGSEAPFRAGSRVSPGQSLNLLEGIAEVSTSLASGSTGRFQLEGPLAMMLNSQGMPSVQFGKLAAQISCDHDPFTLDTPLGWTVVPDEASIGLSVAVNEVELHVFSGEATFEPLWPIDFARDYSTLKIDSGNSLRISVSEDGNLGAERGTADENRFVTRVSMAASRLNITERYVNEIRRAKPLAYWRFESDESGVIRNEMGNDLACRIYGDGVRLRPYNGNHSAEFGAVSGYGYLMSDDGLASRIDQDYSVEAWIKPSHFHHGAFFGLVGETPEPSDPPARAGLLFELRGPRNRWSSQYPTRIRYLHRNPPNYAGGTSCYSAVSYEPRRWQHVVGVKEGSEMRLYVDSQLVALERNSTDLADGLQVLMGQLQPRHPTSAVVVRPFVGELDEAALYDRALREAEVVRHYQLARPAGMPPARDAAPDS